MVVSASTNTTDGVDLSELYIVDNNAVDVMTESFGSCEAGASDSAGISSLAEQAAAEGITYIVSTGDSGAEGCDDPNNETIATGPLSINVLAATPFNLAVGGTMFNEGGQDSKYWGSSNARGTFESALAYIPENVWNESCPAAVCGQNANILAGGGGASVLFAKPSWQSGVQGIPSDGARDIPDVSLSAAGHDPYLLCLQGSCVPDSQGNISFLGVSGTSASAPSFAGIMALVDQKNSSPNFPYVRQGQADYVLYRLAAAEDYSQCGASSPASTCVFNDITVGNNAVPGQTLYGTSSAKYQSGAGYDLATGLGSVNVANLENGWSSITFSPTTTTLSISPLTITHGSPVNVHITVAPSSGGGTPTGNVSLFTDFVFYPYSQAPIGVFTLSGSSVSLSTNSLPGGNYPLIARYGGDKIYAASISLRTSFVTVNPEPSTTMLTIASAFNQSGNPIPFTGGPYGSFAYLRADVKGNSGFGTPTGNVTFTDTNSAQSVPTLALNSQGNTATPNGFFTFVPGQHSVAAVYNSDPSFNTSTSGTDSFTITQAATTTTLSTTASAQGVVFNVVVNTSSGGNPPTGIVTFSSGTTQLGTAQLSGGINAQTGFAKATATFTDAQLNKGQYTVTASYSGDTNYVTSTSAPVGVSVQSDFSLTGSGAIIIPSPGQSGTLTLTINANNGFSGTVTFSCTGLPSEATCAAPPVTTSGTTTLTVSTTGSHTVARRAANIGVWTSTVGLGFAGFVLLGIPGRRQRQSRLIRTISLLACLIMGIGCGGGSSNSNNVVQTDPGTPAGTYTVTVTGTSGSLVHNMTFTLTVQ